MYQFINRFETKLSRRREERREEEAIDHEPQNFRRTPPSRTWTSAICFFEKTSQARKVETKRRRHIARNWSFEKVSTAAHEPCVLVFRKE
jgi:hypothetical protein